MRGNLSNKSDFFKKRKSKFDGRLQQSRNFTERHARLVFISDSALSAVL